MVYGCEKKEEPVQQEKIQEEKKEESKEEDIDENITENTEEDVENNAVLKKMKIYYVDANTAEIVSKEIEDENVTSELIWSQLKEEGILSKESELNNFNVNEAEKKLDMDVNSGFGNYIRSMGTTGQDQIITCVTRSYLETYESVGIRITEDGKVLDTGHTMLDGYIGNTQ